MGTSQAFRVALHIPVLDPSAAQVVSTVAGGDMYTSGWVTTSGISEAPTDGQQYGRQASGWTVVTPNPTWATLSGKPSTFPPTVPIAWTDVSGKPSTFPPTLPIAESDVTNLTADLALKAPLNSPAFTGNPVAPTPAAANSSTSLATTAFVQGEIAAKAPLASPTFSGDPKAPTPTAGDNDTSIATTAFVTNAVSVVDCGTF